MILASALFVFAPATALPAPVASPLAPQWSILRKIGKRADDVAGASSAKRLSGKVDDVLRRLPESSDRDILLVGSDPDGFRVFKPGGSPEGILVDSGTGLGPRIRAAAGSPKVELVLDITTECIDVALELVNEGIDVSFLSGDDEPLKVVTYTPGLSDWAHVEVEAGVLAPLVDPDDLIDFLDSLDGKFRANDVALIGVFERADTARWQRHLNTFETGLRQVEVVTDQDVAARVADLAPDPVLLVGSVDEARFADLGAVHGGPIMAVALASPIDPTGTNAAESDAKPADLQALEFAFQLRRSTAATDVGGFLEALVPDAAPLALRWLEDREDSWVARTPGDGPSAVTIMAQGLGSRGMKNPPPLWIFALIMAVLCAGPAVPLGAFLAGLIGFEPKSWPKLKFAAIGLGPFLPFAERGLMAFFGILFIYWASWATGWVLVRLLRRGPDSKETQKTVLTGLCVVAPLIGVVAALNTF